MWAVASSISITCHIILKYIRVKAHKDSGVEFGYAFQSVSADEEAHRREEAHAGVFL